MAKCRWGTGFAATASVGRSRLGPLLSVCPTSSDASIAMDVGATRWRSTDAHRCVGTPRQDARGGDVEHVLAGRESHRVPTMGVGARRGRDPAIGVEDLDRRADRPRRTGMIDPFDRTRRTGSCATPNARAPNIEMWVWGRRRRHRASRCRTRRRGRVLPARGHEEAHHHAERHHGRRVAEERSGHVI
jgi:hypothetical protein